MQNVLCNDFNKGYVVYWNSRSTAASSIHLCEGSENIIREALDNVFRAMKKRVIIEILLITYEFKLIHDIRLRRPSHQRTIIMVLMLQIADTLRKQILWDLM